MTSLARLSILSQRRAVLLSLPPTAVPPPPPQSPAAPYSDPFAFEALHVLHGPIQARRRDAGVKKRARAAEGAAAVVATATVGKGVIRGGAKKGKSIGKRSKGTGKRGKWMMR